MYIYYNYKGKCRKFYDTHLVTTRGDPVYVCIDKGHECVLTRGRYRYLTVLARQLHSQKRTKQSLYRYVVMCASSYNPIVVNGRPQVTFSFGRLVCMAFYGLPEDPTMEADHIDHNPANNHPSNLRWLPRAANRQDRHIYSPETLLRETARRKAIWAGMTPEERSQYAHAHGIGRPRKMG